MSFARRRWRFYGWDARTDEKVPRHQLITDGHTGLPVTRRSWELKHPSETPVEVYDPEVLARPAPDLDAVPYVVNWPTGPHDALFGTYRPVAASFVLGSVTIE